MPRLAPAAERSLQQAAIRPRMIRALRLVTVAALFMPHLSACSRCDDVLLLPVGSPDGRFVAELTVRTCNDSSWRSTAVLLRNAGWRGLLDGRDPVILLEGGTVPLVRWSEDSAQLDIWHTTDARALASRWEGVTIRFHLETPAAATTFPTAVPVATPAPPPHQIWHGGTGRRAIGHRPRNR